MNFSYEELYSMYGQYDAYVSLELTFYSEGRKKYGSPISGVFIYTIEDRKELEATLKTENFPRTDKLIQFDTDNFNKTLDDKLIEELKKVGIKASDIWRVSSVNLKRENVFLKDGIKTIPNQIPIKFDMSKTNMQGLTLYLYNERRKNNEPLIEEEWNEYMGLNLLLDEIHYFNKTGKYFEDLQDISEDVRYYFYKHKLETPSLLTERELSDYSEISSTRSVKKSKALLNEIKHAGLTKGNISAEEQKLIKSAMNMSLFFEDYVIYGTHFLVWINYERFIHIYFRHYQPIALGHNKRKTSFPYSYKDIHYLIEEVIKIIYNEAEIFFLQNPNSKKFSRYGRQAVYFNGNYYNVTILPSGLLERLYPLQ